MGINWKFCIKCGGRTDLNFVPLFLLLQLNTHVFYTFSLNEKFWLRECTVLKVSEFVPICLYRITKTKNLFFAWVLDLYSDHLVCVSNTRDKKHYCVIVLLCIWYEGTKFMKRRSNVLKNEMLLWSEFCICFCVMDRSVQSVVIPLAILKFSFWNIQNCYVVCMNVKL